MSWCSRFVSLAGFVSVRRVAVPFAVGVRRRTAAWRERCSVVCVCSKVSASPGECCGIRIRARFRVIWNTWNTYSGCRIGGRLRLDAATLGRMLSVDWGIRLAMAEKKDHDAIRLGALVDHRPVVSTCSL